MDSPHASGKQDPSIQSPIETGAFPFALTDGPTESPYLTWLRNRSNYMATQGALDYLRAIGVLVRGVVVNFIIFLPYLLVVALGLAYAHHLMLAYPFYLTLGVLALAVVWILIFPIASPIFTIARYRRTVDTGSASSVVQRDRYERSFGLVVLVVLACAALESLPWLLEYAHDTILLHEYRWEGGLATLAAAVALFSGADKLLSLLSGAKKAVAMLLIGALGLIVPLAVVLYVTDFLVYGLPPSPLMMFSPLVLPVVGVIGILIALPIGYRRRAFTARELKVVVGMLMVTLVLVAAVIVGGMLARGERAAGLESLDQQLSPLQEVVSRLGAVANRQEMAPEVASVVDAFIAAHRTAQSEDAALQRELDTLLAGATDVPCEPSPLAWFADGSRSLRASWECWRDKAQLDARWANWDARYFSVRMPFIVLGHRLSKQSDERLAPLRQRITALARTDTRAQMERVASDERAAEALRSRLVEHFFEAPRWDLDPSEPELARVVTDRFRQISSDDERRRKAVALARTALQRWSATDVAALVGEAALFERVSVKFADVPGRAATARLSGRDALAALLTPGELIDLVVAEHARSETANAAHRRWFVEYALPAFTDQRSDPGNDRDVGGHGTSSVDAHSVAQALASLVEQNESTDVAGASLAFYYGTRGDLAPSGGRDDGTDRQVSVPDPTAAEISSAAGTRLATRALAELDVSPLIVLAFALDQPVETALDGQPSLAAAQADLPDFLAKRSDDLQATVEAVQHDGTEAQLDAFLARTRMPLSELVSRAFPPSRDGADHATSPTDEPAAPESLEGLKLYQWPDRYADRVLLAAAAVGFDTEGLASLARATLAARVLLPQSPVGQAEREQILDEFGLFNPARLSHDELASFAVAHLAVDDSGLADDLLTRVRFGRHGRLEQGGLGKVKRQLTEAVLAPKAIFVALLAGVIWLGCWLTVDVNLTSAHGLYRDRLASAFLVGKDTRGDIAIEDDVDLDDLCVYEARSTAPYHLINAALNLQGSSDVGIRDRQSDFFVFSKRFVGGARTGYCRSEILEQVYAQMSVASAMAISAAAASPNMGRSTSPPLVAFMTLLNIRLGYWMPNPGHVESSSTLAPERQKRSNGSGTAARGFTFDEVFAAEQQEIGRRWGHVYADGARRRQEVSGPTVGLGLVGMAMSGGGIRSASFNLGVVQALHKAGVFEHIDYLSTVSGGGYLGSSISTLMRARERLTSDVDGTVEVTQASPTDERSVTIKTAAGDIARTFRFASYAALNVKHGDRIAAGRPLLKPPAARGQSEIEGTVTIERSAAMEPVVTVTAPSGEKRAYQFSRFDAVSVKEGDTVTVGQDLVRRRDTLGERFRWRVRPTAFLREMLSQLDETHRWVNVSDGAHIENLGVIELLRRRCRYIIVGDGEGDPQLHFAGLATLMRYAFIDLGITIDIDLDELRLRESDAFERATISKVHWAIGTIRYPRRVGETQAEGGYLLYLKSSVSGDEGVMVQEYRHRYPDFPHQTTADQFFDEDQFEAYRALGEHVAVAALSVPAHAAPPRAMSFSDVEAWFHALGNSRAPLARGPAGEPGSLNHAFLA